MEKTAHLIRKRFFILIVGAFLAVLLVVLPLTFLFTGIAISNSFDFPPFTQFSIIARLEGYYMGHGSWEGAEAILHEVNPNKGIGPTLLDASGRIVLDQGATNTAKIGTVFEPASYSVSINLKAQGEVIGTLIYDRETAPTRLALVFATLLPVGLISIFMALLAILVITLISRRMVNPLAEVIAASHAVAAGKLDTRVHVQGNQDLVLLTDSFNQMASALERNDRERRSMLADVAHELRTPLSAMRGRLEGMLDGIYPTDQHHISLALKSGYLLEQLVEDLRLLTLAEARELRFDQKKIDLAQLAAHTLDIFSAEAQEKTIQLEMEAPEAPYWIMADPQRTEQVIGNLVGNALRYVPDGGKVWITLQKNAGTILLTVQDTGPGIPEADLPYIFNRFWRKDKSRSRHSGGSGLGLAIARQFVEAQNGSISAENRPEDGLLVKISFSGLKE